MHVLTYKPYGLYISGKHLLQSSPDPSSGSHPTTLSLFIFEACQCRQKMAEQPRPTDCGFDISNSSAFAGALKNQRKERSLQL